MSEPDGALINGMQKLGILPERPLRPSLRSSSGLFGAPGMLRGCAPRGNCLCRAYYAKIKTELPFDNSYLFQTLF
jgi:hypothetical protein